MSRLIPIIALLCGLAFPTFPVFAQVTAATGAQAVAPIVFARQAVDEALAAYRKGDGGAAQRLAVRALLEGFEPSEASLKNLDPDFAQRTEREMVALRALIERKAPAAEVAAQGAAVQALLKQAEERLGGGALSAAATLLSAFLTLLREGLEAILVLAAIIAYVVKTGRRDALPYIHTGWASALVLGAATWYAAGWLIDLSGADRETTEGVTALIAAAILLYVGLWLHGKGRAQGWQSFLDKQITAALDRRTLWAMTAVAFLAVYREIFETVLFYEALWAQAGTEGRAAFFSGLAGAAAALLVIGWAVFKYSLRLPLRLFFSVTSMLIAVLAVVFAGQGTAALQEAGLVPVDSVAFVSLPVLGIFPTVETLGAQLAVIVMLAAGFWLTGRNTASQ